MNPDHDDEPDLFSAPPLPRQDGRSSLAGDLRELPRAFWVLFTGTFNNRFGTFVMPFLAIYLTREGYTITKAGLAISAYGAGALLASLIGGHLADTIGRRHTMVVGSWSAAASLIALYYASGLPAIMAVAAINGFANALYNPAASALIADLVPDRLRVRAFAGLRFAVNAGFGLGSAAAGFLAKYSFAWLFYGDALTLIIFGTIALFYLPHGVRQQRGGHGYVPWSTALGRIFRDRAFVAMFASALLSAIVFSQFNTSYGLEVERRGFDTTVYGSLLALNGLMVILFELPLTSLTMRFAAKRVIALGYAVLGCGFALNAIGSSLTVLFLSMALFTLGEMIALPMQSAYVARIAPRDLRGRYSGALGMAWCFASALGPAGGMWIFATHHDALWISCGAFGLLAAGVMLVFGAKIKLGD
jgi:MFS family permease